MRSDLPAGTVTFLFTDVEGSTKLLHSLGAEAYADSLAEHRAIIRAACTEHGGVEVDTQGDAFFFAFATAPGALAAADAFTRTLASTEIHVRVGIHTGTALLAAEGYVGDDVHVAARVGGAAHGGQVVVSSVTAELVEDHLVSLGTHRLKDIAEPVSLFQLGASSFPPLKTIANANLPTPASSFLGREAELVEVDQLLQSTRLLTIHGPGGQGKTRFAIELATRAREERFGDYRDGVFSCFLASLRDPALVLPTIAQTLSVKEQPGQSALEALASHLQGKRLLLLLDNLEHLLEAAAELSQLLQACPSLTLLVTSRERLRIQGEEAYALPPLPENEGIALFCERAKTEPSPTIAQIATRLEGLPLAIELAAARTRILSPEQLLERLSSRLDLLKGGRDADPRQQTLRATIEWSYGLLTPDEQRLFRALSVFQGGCTLEAAEDVADADLDSLQSLVDKSLLRHTDERFWLLETIREYARETLEEAGEQDARRERHTAFYVGLAEGLERELEGAGQLVALRALEVEQPNVRAVLERSFREHCALEWAARLAVALVEFWDIRSSFAEARRWYAALIECRAQLPDALVARAFHAAGNAALRQGNADQALPLASTAVDLFEQTRNDRGLARSLGLLTFIHLWRGEIELAAECADRAMVWAERVADPWIRACALAAQSSARGELGDLVEEMRLLEESLRLFVEAGDRRNQAIEHLNLGVAAAHLGDVARARSHFAEAESNARAVEDLGMVANALTEHGELALASGQREEATSRFAEALELGRIYGMAHVVERCQTGLELATRQSAGWSG